VLFRICSSSDGWLPWFEGQVVCCLYSTGIYVWGVWSLFTIVILVFGILDQIRSSEGPLSWLEAQMGRMGQAGFRQTGAAWNAYVSLCDYIFSEWYQSFLFVFFHWYYLDVGFWLRYTTEWRRKRVLWNARSAAMKPRFCSQNTSVSVLSLNVLTVCYPQNLFTDLGIQ